MSYKVNKSNGNLVTTVNDFRKEIVAGLALLGYNYANYGEEIAENFVKIAENWASSTKPFNPLFGQLWYDTTDPLNPILKVCTRQATAIDTVNFTTNNDGSQWTSLFAIDVNASKATILYNGSPAYPDINATPGTLVVRGNDGKIPASSLPNVSAASTAAALSPGATINGTLFNGTNNITINTDAVPQGSSNKYFNASLIALDTNASDELSYNATTGQFVYRSPTVTGVAGVSTFNTRSGAVTLNANDVTTALTFTPANKAGETFTGSVSVQTPSTGGTSGGLRLRGTAGNAAYLQVTDTTGNSQWGVFGFNNTGVASWSGAFNVVGALTRGSATVWDSANDGANSGLDADLLDGQHGAYYLDLANATGSLPSTAVISQRNYGNTGYIVFTGGFCIQWGQYRASVPSEYTIPITYPIAFDNPALSIQVSPYLNYFTNLADIWYQVVGNGTTSGFVAASQSDDGRDMRSEGFNWTAYGTVGLGSNGSGGGSDPGGGNGGGSGGGCVWVGAYLQNNLLVGQSHIGDGLWILDEDGNGYHNGSIIALRYEPQYCWTIETSSGITLTASDSTPITIRDGSSINILQSIGKEVPVWDNGDFHWEEIVALHDEGYRNVALLNAGNSTYAAGNQKNRFIFTHNLNENKNLV